jgi:betaine-aldehyde dehydrogenase
MNQNQQTADAAASLFVNGRWVPAADGGTREIHCPADGTLVGLVSEATTADVESAIAPYACAAATTATSSRPATARQGVTGLRVADASVMPELVTVNPTSP